VGRTNCDHNINYNSGCNVVDWSRASYGLNFESQGGGVLAMKWDENDISVCLSIMLTSYLQLLIELFEGSFFRAAIPKDVTAGSPKPSQWGPPSAMLKNTGCDITKYFMKHTIVFGKYWHNYGALHGRLINNWPRYYTLRWVFWFMISALVLTYIK